jgi:hypothetical protein
MFGFVLESVCCGGRSHSDTRRNGVWERNNRRAAVRGNNCGPDNRKTAFLFSELLQRVSASEQRDSCDGIQQSTARRFGGEQRDEKKRDLTKKKQKQKSVNSVDCDFVLAGTPIYLRKLIRTNKPIVRCSYKVCVCFVCLLFDCFVCLFRLFVLFCLMVCFKVQDKGGPVTITSIIDEFVRKNNIATRKN